MDDITTVVGKQLLDFVDKETGEKIKGINLFIVRPDEHVQGLKALKQFIKPESPAYNDALSIDVSEPRQVEFNYSYSVGQSKPLLKGIRVI